MTLAPASEAPSPDRFELIGDFFVDHLTRLGYRSYSPSGAANALRRVLSGVTPLDHYTGSAVRYNTALLERSLP